MRYYIKDQKESDVADGFVAKSDNLKKDLEWADIVIFDDTLGQGEKAQELRATGKKAVGGTAYSGQKLGHRDGFIGYDGSASTKYVISNC